MVGTGVRRSQRPARVSRRRSLLRSSARAPAVPCARPENPARNQAVANVAVVTEWRQPRKTRGLEHARFNGALSCASAASEWSRRRRGRRCRSRLPVKREWAIAKSWLYRTLTKRTSASWSVWAYARLQVPFRLKDENAWYRLHVSMEQEARTRRAWKQVETVGENLKVGGRQGCGTARGPRSGSRRFPRGVPTSRTNERERVSVAGRQGFEPRYRGGVCDCLCESSSTADLEPSDVRILRESG